MSFCYPSSKLATGLHSPVAVGSTTTLKQGCATALHYKGSVARCAAANGKLSAG